MLPLPMEFTFTIKPFNLFHLLSTSIHLLISTKTLYAKSPLHKNRFINFDTQQERVFIVLSTIKKTIYTVISIYLHYEFGFIILTLKL